MLVQGWTTVVPLATTVPFEHFKVNIAVTGASEGLAKERPTFSPSVSLPGIKPKRYLNVPGSNEYVTGSASHEGLNSILPMLSKYQWLNHNSSPYDTAVSASKSIGFMDLNVIMMYPETRSSVIIPPFATANARREMLDPGAI